MIVMTGTFPMTKSPVVNLVYTVVAIAGPFGKTTRIDSGGRTNTNRGAKAVRSD